MLNYHNTFNSSYVACGASITWYFCCWKYGYEESIHLAIENRTAGHIGRKLWKYVQSFVWRSNYF